MAAMVQIANEAPQPMNNVDEPIVEVSVGMNGTGSVIIDDIQIKD